MSDSPINEFYFEKEMLHAIRKAFKEQRRVALQDFTKFSKNKLTSKWSDAYAPDKYRFKTHAAIPLQQDIAMFVRMITGKTPLNQGVRRFSSGDYTILHDKEPQTPGIIALLFLEDWNEQRGGKIILMKEGETIASFTPQKNTLLIFERKNKERYFVKYVNHKAGKNTLTIISG